MLRFTKIYRQVFASFLLGIFCFVLATQAIHTLVHHHEEKHKICNDTCDKNQAHFHEVEHDFEKCSLCDFTFSIAELPHIQHFTLRNEAPKYTFLFSYQKIFCSNTINLTLSRGPPNI